MNGKAEWRMLRVVVWCALLYECFYSFGLVLCADKRSSCKRSWVLLFLPSLFCYRLIVKREMQIKAKKKKMWNQCNFKKVSEDSFDRRDGSTVYFVLNGFRSFLVQLQFQREANNIITSVHLFRAQPNQNFHEFSLSTFGLTHTLR